MSLRQKVTIRGEQHPGHDYVLRSIYARTNYGVRSTRIHSCPGAGNQSHPTLQLKWLIVALNSDQYSISSTASMSTVSVNRISTLCV